MSRALDLDVVWATVRIVLEARGFMSVNDEWWLWPEAGGAVMVTVLTSSLGGAVRSVALRVDAQSRDGVVVWRGTRGWGRGKPEPVPATVPLLRAALEGVLDRGMEGAQAAIAAARPLPVVAL